MLRYSLGIAERVAEPCCSDARRKRVRSVVSEPDGSASTCVESKKRTRYSGPSGLRWSTSAEKGITSDAASSSRSMTWRRTS
jgi:hypothetical protein